MSVYVCMYVSADYDGATCTASFYTSTVYSRDNNAAFLYINISAKNPYCAVYI